MRKKLDTRFPAARIKKIMQADEDVGKIAMAVPLLVSKALELFLQDLCDHTYEITLKRGAKTMNSLHLKQCVQTFNVFDFLRDIVNKVPDLGGFDAADEDRSAAKRRKVTDDDENDSDDESKRSGMVFRRVSTSMFDVLESFFPPKLHKWLWNVCLGTLNCWRLATQPAVAEEGVGAEVEVVGVVVEQ
ncbi:dr1-associated corepressor-like isoform X3 [Juglans regia]|uniref:Dr1-associated corepressor-like isoform X3 n=1 Tax=Juglans regia TaxID=51240 RepID=A0A6P9EET5_JUGRE|nr:dr1-associated corepressor-like isoform X3 [Juglans regia]